IDVHAHFYTERSARADWRERNASRLAAGDRVGIDIHVASILGTWGRTSPLYFPSPTDITHPHNALPALEREPPARLPGYVTSNRNFGGHAEREVRRCISAGMIGIKLAASRRADDPLVDCVAELAREHRVPILHHIWQHRRGDVPGQEASDAVELGRLAARHPRVSFILAHIGGGGDWIHSLHAVRDLPNIFVDLSGSGVDGGMLEACLDAVSIGRLLWGCDLTIDTGWAKLRYLQHLLGSDDVARIGWKNAAAIFPPGAFPAG